MFFIGSIGCLIGIYIILLLRKHFKAQRFFNPLIMQISFAPYQKKQRKLYCYSTWLSAKDIYNAVHSDTVTIANPRRNRPTAKNKIRMKDIEIPSQTDALACTRIIMS